MSIENREISCRVYRKKHNDPWQRLGFENQRTWKSSWVYTQPEIKSAREGHQNLARTRGIIF